MDARRFARYLYFLAGIFPVVMGWGAAYDRPPVQVFLNFKNGDNTLVQVLDCYPTEYGDFGDEVSVQLNTPKGIAYYACSLTDEIYIRPLALYYRGKKYA